MGDKVNPIVEIWRPDWKCTIETDEMKYLTMIAMFPVFHLVLKPLIKRNYRLRKESALNRDGKHLDEWYWADSLAVKCGYFVE